MRLIFGMILGAAITVAAAYVSDTSQKGAEARPMVNWDVVGKSVDAFTAVVKQGWAKLTNT